MQLSNRALLLLTQYFDESSHDALSTLQAMPLEQLLSPKSLEALQRYESNKAPSSKSARSVGDETTLPCMDKLVEHAGEGLGCNEVGDIVILSEGGEQIQLPLFEAKIAELSALPRKKNHQPKEVTPPPVPETSRPHLTRSCATVPEYITTPPPLTRMISGLESSVDFDPPAVAAPSATLDETKARLSMSKLCHVRMNVAGNGLEAVISGLDDAEKTLFVNFLNQLMGADGRLLDNEQEYSYNLSLGGCCWTLSPQSDTEEQEFEIQFILPLTVYRDKAAASMVEDLCAAFLAPIATDAAPEALSGLRITELSALKIWDFSRISGMEDMNMPSQQAARCVDGMMKALFQKFPTATCKPEYDYKHVGIPITYRAVSVLMAGAGSAPDAFFAQSSAGLQREPSSSIGTGPIERFVTELSTL